METSRLEIFADGVFGIAATLLVVRISVDAPGGALGRALVHAWPQYAAYGVSFLMIGIWWVNYHAFIRVIDHTDRVFLFANLGLLASIAFVPFPTSLVAEHVRDSGLRPAVILYGLTLITIASFMNVLWFYAARGRRLIASSTDQRVVNNLSRYIALAPLGMLVATLIALWNPYVTLGIIVVVGLTRMVGSSGTKAAEAEPPKNQEGGSVRSSTEE